MRLLRRALLAGLCAALVGLAAAPAVARDAGGKVAEGRPAPAVDLRGGQVEKALPDKKGAQDLNLKDLRGKKNVVLLLAITP